MSQDFTNATVKLPSSDEVNIVSDDVKAVGKPFVNDRATPMIAQYLGIKKEHPNSLLFYRMGDFYELFFEDAVKAAAALDIALTKRGKHLEKDIPMCGVPVHSHAAYLHRLIRNGYRVAICEQMEDPEQAKKRGSKAVVRREVVRIVTPGTLTEDILLDARRHNYLAGIAQAAGNLGLAWVDVSTGILMTQPLAEVDLDTSLARIEPGELVISENLLENPIFKNFRSLWGERLSPQPQGYFDSSVGRERLKTIYGVSTLDGFGNFSRAEIAAAGGIVEYVQLTQKGKLPRFSFPIRHITADIMEIDPATRRNLELVQTLAGEKQGGLLSVIDKTVTGAGARAFADRLSQPLTNPERISRRLDAVQCFVEDSHARTDLRKILSEAPDVVRALSRLTLGRGGPRDLASVRNGLVAAENIGARILSCTVISLPDNVAAAQRNLTGHKVCIDRLDNALADDLPLLVRDGGFIRTGYNSDLDDLVALRDKGRQHVASLQAKYVSETQLSGLKIKHNNVIGYFVELPTKQAERLKMVIDSPFIHRQTMASAMRFSTIELSELEGQIFTAAERAQALEVEIFEDLVSAVCLDAGKIASCADALAKIDVFTALADLAITRRYVRPEVDGSYAFEVRGGRHPVVEFALEQAMEGPFVANDCVLDTSEGPENGGRLWLLTGPNMAGKSTFLRQNALISIMAQMGSFVPAESARVGIVDRLFSRVGASDDLAQGRSTFMVEMVETATILNQAGPRALVILDEIGRGTATYDGLSIAWAVVEHLHESNRCRALFATHYHELTALADRLDALRCQTMKVKEWNDDVIFLHQVAEGTADRSYGIHVGKLAGLPKTVVARAEAVLKALETDQYGLGMQKLSEDLPLFQVLQKQDSQSVDSKPSDIESAIDCIVPDEMSPRVALEFIYKIKKIREGN